MSMCNTNAIKIWALTSEITKGCPCGHPFVKFIWLNLCLLILWSHLWEEEHILDGRGVGHEHSQTVDTHTES